MIQPGCRLPPQREAADTLGLGVGTVTRAYREAEILGLVESHVGRGTFVRGRQAFASSQSGDFTIDLSLNLPPFTVAPKLLHGAIQRLASQKGAGRYLTYGDHAGDVDHRRLLATWLGGRGLDATSDNTVICNGAQHAMSLAFAALCAPGDAILCESATYYGLKNLASYMQYNLIGLEMDEEGLMPEALEAACSLDPSRVLYTIPTLQNPTARTMSAQRRRDIVAIARRYDLWIVEDDSYGFLAEPAPMPLTALAPERTLYLDGTSKCLAPGLRVGVLVTPIAHVETICRAMRATCWMTPPLMVEMVCGLIEMGHMQAMVQRLRGEAAHRIGMVRQALEGLFEMTLVPAFHVWLPCHALTAERLANRLQQEGVVVTPPAAPFVNEITAATDTGLRLCIGAPEARETLAAVLQKLRHAAVSIGQEELSLI